ncbi:MAG: SRPBCC family protein [Pseudomonadota bacterium]
MPAVERTLFIRAAPEAVFDLIARVEHFPQYSPAIREVRALGRDTYRWVVSVAGFALDWDSVVTEKTRPARFAWRSVRGIENGGLFRLAPADGGTEVRFTMEYRLTNPLLERIIDAIAAPLMERVAGEILEQVRRRTENPDARTAN